MTEETQNQSSQTESLKDTIYNEGKPEQPEAEPETEDKNPEAEGKTALGESKNDKSDADADAEGEDDKGDEQPDADAKDEGGEDDKDDNQPEPIKLELAEDLNVPEDVASDLEGLVNELKKPDADPNKVVNDFVKGYNEKQEKLAEEAKSSAEKQQQEAFENEVKNLTDKARKDEEIGGAEFDKNISVAKKALKKFGGDDLLEALDVSGMGSHPEIIRFAYRVGKAMSNGDVFTGGGETPGKDVPLHDQIYNKK